MHYMKEGAASCGHCVFRDSQILDSMKVSWAGTGQGIGVVESFSFFALQRSSGAVS